MFVVHHREVSEITQRNGFLASTESELIDERRAGQNYHVFCKSIIEVTAV
jgi:hypothetical protein